MCICQMQACACIQKMRRFSKYPIIFVAVSFQTIFWSNNNQIIFPCCRFDEDKPLQAQKKRMNEYSSLIKNLIHSSVATRLDNKRSGLLTADCFLDLLSVQPMIRLNLSNV